MDASDNETITEMAEAVEDQMEEDAAEQPSEASGEEQPAVEKRERSGSDTGNASKSSAKSKRRRSRNKSHSKKVRADKDEKMEDAEEGGSKAAKREGNDDVSSTKPAEKPEGQQWYNQMWKEDQGWGKENPDPKQFYPTLKDVTIKGHGGDEWTVSGKHAYCMQTIKDMLNDAPELATIPLDKTVDFVTEGTLKMLGEYLDRILWRQSVHEKDVAPEKLKKEQEHTEKMQKIKDDLKTELSKKDATADELAAARLLAEEREKEQKDKHTEAMKQFLFPAEAQNIAMAEEIQKENREKVQRIQEAHRKECKESKSRWGVLEKIVPECMTLYKTEQLMKTANYLNCEIAVDFAALLYAKLLRFPELNHLDQKALDVFEATGVVSTEEYLKKVERGLKLKPEGP